MTKIICEVEKKDVLKVAQELEANTKIKGISFKYDNRPGLFKGK